MSGILAGMRVIEGSAFVAAPLGGMTLAQMGAEVIRFDPPGGGLDYHRWPVTRAGHSLFWAGLNKGKRSIVVDFRKPEGQELARQLIGPPGLAYASVFALEALLFVASAWLALMAPADASAASISARARSRASTTASSSEPNVANASSSRNWARSSFSVPVTKSHAKRIASRLK